MTKLSEVSIAGVNLKLFSPHKVTLEKSGSAYNSFIGAVIDIAGAIDVEVQLELATMPDTARMTRIFDTEQVWSMFKQGRDYFMVRQLPDSDPLWVARFDNTFRAVTVFCGEKLQKRAAGNIVLFNPIEHPLDQLLLMYILAGRQGAIFHAAGVNLNDQAYVFPGKSGAGKSTLARQFLADATHEVLSDDRIVIRKIEGQFVAFGTPWLGDAGVARNESRPLAGIFFITQSPENKISNLTTPEALQRLLPITSIPWYDRDIMPDILSFCDDLITSIPCYELQCRPTPEVVNTVQAFQTRIASQ
ncbi:hypothetical protein ACFL27_23875 [candidate division CSSED10-310 bacterium]|uniref:HPr kinase/phosphorylase C-terminal domain-containing protein n=1 Tax=candidate division CSSED10-310 bacterium TaxID=2855610 RepID=A0ABV6Z478_UNCC1